MPTKRLADLAAAAIPPGLGAGCPFASVRSRAEKESPKGNEKGDEENKSPQEEQKRKKRK